MTWPKWLTPFRTTARMTALRPGQSPPPVRIPMRAMLLLRVDGLPAIFPLGPGRGNSLNHAGREAEKDHMRLRSRFLRALGGGAAAVAVALAASAPAVADDLTSLQDRAQSVGD